VNGKNNYLLIEPRTWIKVIYKMNYLKCSKFPLSVVFQKIGVKKP